MKFLQHCFIRKNTPELRKKLESFGFRHNELDDGCRPWLAANHGMYISVDEGFHRLPLEDIDCGENEEMFLALAALNEENDYGQWFISKVSYKTQSDLGIIEAGTWHKMNLRSLPYCLARRWRKATVEEIVEHFRKEEEGWILIHRFVLHVSSRSDCLRSG